VYLGISVMGTNALCHRSVPPLLLVLLSPLLCFIKMLTLSYHTLHPQISLGKGKNNDHNVMHLLMFPCVFSSVPYFYLSRHK
jgi:hypothetical protein